MKRHVKRARAAGRSNGNGRKPEPGVAHLIPEADPPLKVGDYIADPDRLDEPAAFTDEDGTLHINRVPLTNPDVVQRLRAVKESGGDVAAEVKQLLVQGAAQVKRWQDEGKDVDIPRHEGETDEEAFSRFVLNNYHPIPVHTEWEPVRGRSCARCHSTNIVDRTTADGTWQVRCNGCGKTTSSPGGTTRRQMGTVPTPPVPTYMQMPPSDDPKLRQAMSDAMVRSAQRRLDGEGPPIRPGTEARVWAQAHPEVWNMAEEAVCPRCGGEVPEPGRRGQYRGALSRTDQRTEICTPCGIDEAYEQAAGALRPQSAWPVPASSPRPSRVVPAGELPGYRDTWEDIRGGNRLPRQPVPTPRELPDLRLHLMEKWLPDGVFSRSLGENAYPAAVTAVDPQLAASLDGQYQRLQLEHAGLWWVRDEMVDLVTVQTRNMPADLKAGEVAASLPAGQDNGMMVLGKPYVGTDAFNPDHRVEVDVMCWGMAKAKMGTVPCLSLTMYRYFDFSGGLSRGALEEAVASGAIYDAAVQRFIRNMDKGTATARLAGGSWVYVGRTDWPLDDELEGFAAFAEEAGRMSDHQRLSMIEDRRFFAAFCLLVNIKLTEVEDHPADRQVVRRTARALKREDREAKEISKVRIVRLREVRRRPGDSDAEHDKKQVEWTHRWMSSAHWGWRWFGHRDGERYRRRVPVSASIKGPADLPLVIKETVRVWRR
jgi:hypothetical protein